jgi:hypothetical protein
MPAPHTPWSNRPGERPTEPFEAGAPESADFGADTEQSVQADDDAAGDHSQHTRQLVGFGISVALLVLALVWILAMAGQRGSSSAAGHLRHDIVAADR